MAVFPPLRHPRRNPWPSYQVSPRTFILSPPAIVYARDFSCANALFGGNYDRIGVLLTLFFSLFQDRLVVACFDFFPLRFPFERVLDVVERLSGRFTCARICPPSL